MSASMEQFKDLLGQDKVITAEQAANAWGLEVPHDIPIRYSEKTLSQVAEENRLGQADWRLIYCYDISLSEQFKLTNSRTSFFDELDLSPEYRDSPGFELDYVFMDKNCGTGRRKSYKPLRGYYLINFQPQFTNMSYYEQCRAISNIGPGFERCHETILAQAVLSIFIATGERMLQYCVHLGYLYESDNPTIITIGNLRTSKICISAYYRWDTGQKLVQVCVLRKFEF